MTGAGGCWFCPWQENNGSDAGGDEGMMAAQRTTEAWAEISTYARKRKQCISTGKIVMALQTAGLPVPIPPTSAGF